jgi:hypothetical protein
MGGTPSGDRAAAWLAARFAEAGLATRVVDDPPLLVHWHERWSVRMDPGDQLASAYPLGFSPDRADASPMPLVFVADLLQSEPDRSWTNKALYTRTPAGQAVTRLRAAGVAPAVLLTSAPHTEGAYGDWPLVGSLRPSRDQRIPAFAVSYNDGVALEAAASRGASISAVLDSNVDDRAPKTVIASLPGRVTSRYVLLTAHGDSDAGGPGADDNASGVATVLEIARGLARLRRSGELPALPVSVRFAVLGAEYHSSQAYIQREGRALGACLAVINFDQTGTGAEREAVYFESNDVPWNEPLLRTLAQVGRDYRGRPGFWPEFATTPSQGGTDSFAFLPREHGGQGHTPLRIPATTVYTAAWGSPRSLPQTPGWHDEGQADPETVFVDYSRFYHSSADTPENTTEREPQNMVRAARAAGIALLRLVYDPRTAGRAR